MATTHERLLLLQNENIHKELHPSSPALFSVSSTPHSDPPLSKNQPPNVMAEARRVEEALTHIRAAEKSLKTGLLKWQPDYEIACDEYQQAATCYRNARLYNECRACLMKAADCHLQTRSLFHAAKCFEQVILMMREQGVLGEIEAMAHRACKLYQQQGSPEAGATALDKAAKIVEPTLPEHALNLYRHAVEVTQLEDHARQAGEYQSKVSRILVRLRRFDEAAEALRHEIGIAVQTESAGVIGRLTVALVLVQLAREDSVAGEKVFREFGGYCDVNEVMTLETLLQAYDEEDADAAKRALKSPFIMHMDVEYARLARDLKLPEGIPAAVVTTKPAAVAASSGGGMFDEEEEEDEVVEVASSKPQPMKADETEQVREKLEKKSLFEDDEEEEVDRSVKTAAKPAAAKEEEDDDDEGLC